MNAHVLLNLLNKLGKRDKMRGLPSILSLFAADIINSMIQEHDVGFYLSHDIKMTLKSHFWRENIIFYARLNCTSCIITKSVNHLGDNCIQIFHLGRYIV